MKYYIEYYRIFTIFVIMTENFKLKILINLKNLWCVFNSKQSVHFNVNVNNIILCSIQKLSGLFWK